MTGTPGVEAVDRRVTQATDALGWAGVVLAGVSLLGTRTTMVVGVDAAAHHRRRESGCAVPESDRGRLAAWEWPQLRDVMAPTVVTLRGVLVPATGGRRRALGTACRWNGFCSTAVLVSEPVTRRRDFLAECSRYGVGVTSSEVDGRVTLAQPGRSGRSAAARRSWLDRWVEEQVYGRLLDGGLFGAEDRAGATGDRLPALQELRG